MHASYGRLLSKVSVDQVCDDEDHHQDDAEDDAENDSKVWSLSETEISQGSTDWEVQGLHETARVIITPGA